jgi:hypothetical protein
MKNLRLMCCFAIILMIIASCKKEASNELVLINFINLTGAKINFAIVDDISIGNIENNGQTGFIEFEKFRTDTNMPDCNFVGIRNFETLKSTSIFYWCGTQKLLLHPGEYHIEIKLKTSNSTNYFDLRFR